MENSISFPLTFSLKGAISALNAPSSCPVKNKKKFFFCQLTRQTTEQTISSPFFQFCCDRRANLSTVSLLILYFTAKFSAVKAIGNLQYVSVNAVCKNRKIFFPINSHTL